MITNDIRNLLNTSCRILNNHDVQYIIIGGIAVASYGYQRLSETSLQYPEIKHDIDIWYNPTIRNYNNLLKALKEMGVNTSKLEEVVFDKKTTYLRIPFKNFKMEFLPELSGLSSFTECLKNASRLKIDQNDVYVLGYEDLIKNKKTINRKIDKRDIDQLQKIRKKKGK